MELLKKKKALKISGGKEFNKWVEKNELESSGNRADQMEKRIGDLEGKNLEMT